MVGGKGLKIIFILLILLFFGNTANATTYYFSSDGTGDGLTIGNPGDPSTLAGDLQAGDVGKFLPGTYSGENIVIFNSGTSENPITLTADSTMPVISGSSKTGTGISITGDYVTVDGLNITDYSKGISASGADYLTVQNCDLVNNYDGLYIDDSDFATVQGNTILGNVLLDETQTFENGLGTWTEGHATGSIIYTGTGITTDDKFNGGSSYRFAAQGVEGSWPQVWITRSFDISSSSTYYVNVEGYTKAGMSDSGMTARSTTSISNTSIPYISISSWMQTGYYGTDWEPGITDKTFASSVNTFYVMMGIYPSKTWSGYLDDVRVLAYGNDTHNGITILNSSSPLIQDNMIQYLGSDGINLIGCSYPRINADTIKYVYRSGVNSTNTSTYTNLTNSTIYKTGNCGALLTQEYVTANNNTLSHTNVSAIAVQIPNVESHGHSNITNNTIFVGQSYTGVSSASINTGVSSIVTNNRLNFGTTGVKADALSVISNNTFWNLSQNSVDIEYRQYNLTITNNTFTSQKLNVGAFGLRLKMLYNSVIRNNSFDNIGTAIGLLAYNSINSEKNIIENNTINNGLKGITAEQIVDNTIINNTFSNQTTNSIELQGPIYTWESFRKNPWNTGTTSEYILPSPFGIVAEIKDSGYSTPGLTTLWTSNLTTPIKSTPATYDNVLYVVTNGTLYAINNNDGSQIWNYSTGNIYPSTVSGIGNVLIHSSPAINNSVVFFGSGTTLYAVNTSGSLVWSYPTGGQVISSPQAIGNNVYVGSTDGKLYAINKGNGSLNWSYTLNDPIVSTPCIVSSVNGRYGITAKGYNGSIAELYDNGSIIWNTTLPKSGGWSSPGYNQNDTYTYIYLYIGTAANETGWSSLYAYNVTTGAGMWTQNGIRGNITASPELNGGGSLYLNVMTDTGAAYLLLLTSGGGTPFYSNTAYGSSAFIGSSLGYGPGIISVDSTGNIYRDYQYLSDTVRYRWRSSVPTNVSSSPIHSYGKLFVCGENGIVYALVPASNVTISGNNISNVPVGIYSYSTEARVHNNTFSNVSKYVNYTQYFSLTGTIENNTLISSPDIEINKNSYVIAKYTNIPNISFINSGAKFAIENNDIRLTTQLNTIGKITRSIANNDWSQSYLAWNDSGSGFTATYTVSGLEPDETYYLKKDGTVINTYTASSDGKLTFSNSEWSEHNFTIESEEQYPPVADFTSDVTTGNYPLRVQFTSNSTGNVSTYAWDLDNNGVIDSTEQNPVKTYLTKGNYTVSLTVSNVAGSNTTTKTQYIQVAGTSPTKLTFFSRVGDWINIFYRRFIAAFGVWLV